MSIDRIFSMFLHRCFFTDSLLQLSTTSCSYFFHPQLCFNLSKKNCYKQGCCFAIKSPHFSLHLQKFIKIIWPLLELKKLYLHCLRIKFKLFSSLSLCSSEHGTIGKTTGVQLLLLPASRPEGANPEPPSLAMFTTFLFSLNISLLQIKPKPSVCSSTLQLLHTFSHLMLWLGEFSLILLNIWVTVHLWI